MKLTEYEEQITGAVEKLSESVVSITSIRMGGNAFSGFAPVQGAGTGVILDKKGYIVTNNHVIERAEQVRISLKDGRSFQGSVIGSDPATDLAIVKISEDRLPCAPLGDSSELKVGQIVLAIGNALGLPGGHSVSTGVVSAYGRPLPGTDFIHEGFIQTDAAINPGNSGGPLADIKGNVIGINTAMIPYAQGIGFAIPINTAKWVIQQILEKGRVIRPWLGIVGLDINPLIVKRFELPVNSGILIVNVVPDSPIQKAGIKQGDILRAVENAMINKTSELIVELSNYTIGTQVTFVIFRDGKEQKMKVPLLEVRMRK
ncbi:trypsin-like peptidase domain-containing protein [Candidatus Micrarchaeota archaeon]|nr:trypsin-like peptidase domain-containing protein [Candidatus Micrarchaeota archaeon]